MNRLEINPDNEKYYSKEFMQGYKCGTKSQFHEDMKVLEQIRQKIEAIEINGQVDEHTMFIRTGEQVKRMALEIIDKYK